MDQMSRREFVVLAGACAMCALGADALGQRQPGNAAPRKPVEIGTIADFPKDGIYDKFARQHRFFVMRRDDQIFASSSICTHKRTALNKISEDQLQCPNHGSKFTEYGTPTEGPAKVALPRYKITKTDDGKLIVDPNVDFEERDWENAESFVSTK